MNVKCTKSDAASRQLDVAIVLLLNDTDPLAVRTLAAAAHGVFADLADSKGEGGSWRSKIIEDSGLEKKESVRILNEAQNFLKHADRDPDAVLSFNEEENDHVIFLATIECAGLGYPLSIRMQAYQVWYLAAHPEKLGHESEPVIAAKKAFPELSKLPREEQLASGQQFLVRALSHRGEP